MIIVDDFLSDTSFKELKSHSRSCEFKDEINPIDGVVYPHICRNIPEPIENDLKWMLGSIVHRKPKDAFTFMRMSPKGVKCPHIAHNDSSMGKYSCMLYLENNPNAGTGMLYHKENHQNRPNGDMETLIRDQNNIDKWVVYEKAEMKENRGVVFQSDLMHCALPFGGYGTTQEDARIVLTCFFS